MRDILLQARSSPFVLHVQGIPGIGKSALLAVLARDAESLGYSVSVAPPEDTSRRIRRIAKRIVPAREKTLIVVDDWDALGEEEAPLIAALEKVSGPLVLLTGSRARPRSLLASALSPERLRVIELGGISEEEGILLLSRHHLSASEARLVHRECSGLPLALLLVASMIHRGARAISAAGMGRLALAVAVLADLVRRLLGRIEDPRKSDALELLSLTGILNERELQRGLCLSVEDAHRIFEWLVELTIVRVTDAGLVLHDLVRAALAADRRLRDPTRARALMTNIVGVIEENLSWKGVPRSRSLSQLGALAASAPQDPALAAMFEPANERVATPGRDELAEALELIEAWEGHESAVIAERFVEHDPTSATIVRGANGVGAVMIRVELRGRDIPSALLEPGLTHLVDVLDRSRELQPGMLIRVTRFFLAREGYQAPCPELGALAAAITRQTLETEEPFLSVHYLEMRAVQEWGRITDVLGCFDARGEAAVELGSRRMVPFIAHIHDLGETLLSLAHRAWGLSPASGLNLEAETIRALSHMRDRIWLATSSLGAHLFEELDEATRAARLQDWLVSAVAATENMHGGDRVARALRASFEASRSVEEAAAVARMGVSTLKRYKKQGVKWIAALARSGADIHLP